MNMLDSQYEEAVKTLNNLQSNASVLEKIRKSRKIFESNNVTETLRYLQRVDLGPENLDKLPVIHVAGTKGKGSTCAFVEHILRENGLKTGFYSSPHLVAVRERIRINGIPIDKEDFVKFFWETYDKLKNSTSQENDMPAYFKFLTILAFKVFLEEQVDVAIMEVGIGGEFDCTNVVRKPVVCGISSLDIDHTSQLGDTIESISWHKAGIMKNLVPVFTVPQQPSNALPVLLERSKEKKCPLYVVPPLESYDWGGRPIVLGLCGYVQFLNASLALQLSRYFLSNRKRPSLDSNGSSFDSNGPSLDSEGSSLDSKEPSIDSKGSFLDSKEPSLDSNQEYGKALQAQPFVLSEIDVSALANVVWPGRSQVLKRGKYTFFIDGAHTLSSIQNCVEWYSKISTLHGSSHKDSNVFRVLVFNITGDRDHESILRQLFPCSFDLVLFTTNMVTKNMTGASDQTNFTVSEVQQISRSQKLRKFWISLGAEFGRDIASTCNTFYCIKDLLLWLSCGRNTLIQERDNHSSKTPMSSQPEDLINATHVQVLVTGSLHLVGGVLGILDPDLSCSQGHNDPSMAHFLKKTLDNYSWSITGTS